jgi:hypothetical protein
MSEQVDTGITMLDEIAMEVMSSLITLSGGQWYDEEDVAEYSYRMARAMIAERNKGLH